LVAQVETAVPAFIGYTETAVDPNVKSLLNLPVMIKLMVDFQFLFPADIASCHNLPQYWPLLTS
jgi:phage tail sheath protein FI